MLAAKPLLQWLERPPMLFPCRSCTLLQVMTTEAGKSCHSGEEVLALKKFISKSNLDNEKLKDVIAVNKSRDDFLLKFR